MSSFRVTNWLEYKYREVRLDKCPNVPGSINVSSFSVRYNFSKESKPSNIPGVTTVRALESRISSCSVLRSAKAPSSMSLKFAFIRSKLSNDTSPLKAPEGTTDRGLLLRYRYVRLSRPSKTPGVKI